MAQTLFFLLIICAFSSSMEAKKCPNCGSTAVPYPLSTGDDCGDQAYKIRCVSGSLVFDSIDSSYAINMIKPQTQRLVIRPANFVSNSCISTNFATGGIILNRSLPFNITGSNTFMLLNCTRSVLQSPLECSASSLCHTYINQTAEGTACRNTNICCTFRSGGSSTSHQIRLSACTAYRSFVDLDQSMPLSRWPAPGIELQWLSPREPECRTQTDCDDVGNSRCAPDPNVGGRRRCFCNGDLRWDPINAVCATVCDNPGDCNGSNKRIPLIVGLTVGVGAVALASTVFILLYRHHQRIKKVRERLAKERETILSSSAKYFTGKQMKKATNNFSNDLLLGVGGYGEVYKGFLEDGVPVAVKCAKLGNIKSTEQILNEVRILSQVNHRSLVRLLGCCVELEQPLMIYEFIPNGTLYDHLHSSKSLTWHHRLSIAHQTAEGLAYLHSSAVPPIYHRDVKSSNILLDEKLNAKVSDFGLSRLALPGLSHISTCAQGTLGYLDPEYYRNYQLTDKSDVYSFGVVLLEILTSQKVIDFNRDVDDVNLAIYVQRKVDEEKLMETIDPSLTQGATPVELDTMKAIGLLAISCLEEKRQNRPSMKEVAEEIEYIMSIDMVEVVE